MKINKNSQYISLVLAITEFEQKSKEDINYSPFARRFKELFPKKDFNKLTLGELSQVSELPPITKEQMNMKIKDFISKKYAKTLIKRQMR